MLTCFNCGQRYTIVDSIDYEFCSIDCAKADSDRLTEGNAIIDMAMRENPDAFSDINRLRLDAQGLNASSTLNLAKLGVNTLKRES